MVKVNGAWCRSYSPCAIVGYLESTNVTKIIRTLLVGGMGEIENLEGIAPNTPHGLHLYLCGVIRYIQFFS